MPVFLILIGCLWLVSVYVVWRVTWTVMKKAVEKGPLAPAFWFRTVLRSLPLAYLLTPTVAAGGWFAIPLPAGPVFFLLILSAPLNYFGIGKDALPDVSKIPSSFVIFTSASFLSCWIFFSAIHFSISSWKFLNRHPEWPVISELDNQKLSPRFAQHCLLALLVLLLFIPLFYWLKRWLIPS
jgi:hypothetical protein